MSDVPLREYLERLIDDLDRRLSAAIDDRDARTQLALSSNDKRLDLLNEFAGQSRDRDARYASREAVDQQIASLGKEVARNTTDLASLQGRLIAVAGVGALFGAAVAGVIAKLTGA